MAPTPTTLKEIAQRSGYSIATVSRALNSSPLAGKTAAKKITAIAAELGYTPNFHARILQGGSTKIIGFFTQELSAYIDRKLVDGIEIVARENEFNVFVCLYLRPESEIADYLTILRQSLFAGFIVGMEVSAPLREALRTCANVVWADQWPQGAEAATVVTSDHDQANSLMMEFFIKHDVKRLLYYGMGNRNAVESQRFAGLMKECGKSGIPFVHIQRDLPALLAYAAEESAHPAAPPHAILFEPTLPGDVPNPMIDPPEALRAFLARNVGGFYDIAPDFLHVAKTLGHGISILQDHQKVGSEACRLLLGMIEGKACPTITRVPVTSVEF